MQHRKRRDSLEQKLVIPSINTSPLSSSTAHLRGYPNPISSEFLGPDPDNNFLSYVPFSSLSAFLLCLTGVILFTTMMTWAFNATIEMVRRTLYITDMAWLDKVQLLFILSAVVMFLVVLAFLLIGILSTGKTRKKLFKLEQARRGGRISCMLAICLASFLHLLWTFITIITAIICFVFTIFSALCAKSNNLNNCLNFNVLHPLFYNSDLQDLEFCNGQLQQFCAISNAVVVWYYIGLLGSLLICFGLAQFITTNSVNYTQIGSERRYGELCEVLKTEVSNKYSHPYIGGQPQLPLHESSFMEKSFRKLPLSQYYDHNNMVDYQRQNYSDHYHASRSQMRMNKSIGAVLGNHRRHSYQNSLNDSNNCLNEMENIPRRNMH